VPFRTARPIAALAALLLLVQAFVPGIHVLQHALSADADRAAGRVHVCPLHPRPLGDCGDGEAGNDAGTIELVDCALGLSLQHQLRWAPVTGARPVANMLAPRERVHVPVGGRTPRVSHTTERARGPPTA
jgi:hypothetical protein